LQIILIFFAVPKHNQF